MQSFDQANLEEKSKGSDDYGVKLGYMPALDGLRGISILAVMAFNGHFFSMNGGFVGVDIFFVLSGFLITLLLIEEYDRNSRISLKNFYFRRALRLFPALFVLLLFCVVYAVVFQSSEKASVTFKGAIYTFFYASNWVQIPPNPPGIGALSHAWSLSVEEQFYIVWPLILLALLKWGTRWFIATFLALLITVSISLNVYFWYTEVPYLRMYFGTDTRANEILIGCLTAFALSWGVFRPFHRLKWLLHVGAVTSLVGIIFAFFLARHDEAFVYNGGFALISIGTAILILDLLLFPSALSRCFEFGPLVWIGRISYGLYLWHFPIFETSRKLFEGSGSVVLPGFIGVIGSLLAATASYYFVEQPFLKYRNRYNSKGTSAPPLAVSSRMPENA